jgi:hypothetical protein
MNLKIRASSLGKIMSDDSDSKITIKQLDLLNTLLSKIKLTENQAKKRDMLIAKRDAAPKLSKGAQTYIRQLWLENNYAVYQNVENKYIDKGNIVEDLSIQLVEVVLKKNNLLKNDKKYSNKYVHGTPDVVVLDDCVIDVKSSWNAATFPFFEDKIPNNLYLWQLKAYMWLTNIHKSFLCYCLVPTPEHLIFDEINRLSYRKNEIEISEETENEVRKLHNIDKIPIEKRLKCYEVNLHEDDIKKMKEKVKLANQFYDSIQ